MRPLSGCKHSIIEEIRRASPLDYWKGEKSRLYGVFRVHLRLHGAESECRGILLGNAIVETPELGISDSNLLSRTDLFLCLIRIP